MQSNLDCSSFQYTDDTTLYEHCRPQELTATVHKLNDNICNFEDWATKSNLMLNRSKTKWMLIATKQMSAAHALKDVAPEIAVKGEVLERTSSFKLLGTWLNEHLEWADHIRILTSSCYAVLYVLQKLKNLAPYNVRKQLVECLVYLNSTTKM